MLKSDMHKEDSYIMKFIKHIFNKHRVPAIAILSFLAILLLIRLFSTSLAVGPNYTPGETLDPAEGPGTAVVVIPTASPGDAAGAVQFNSDPAGTFTGNAADFFWDPSNKFLNLGTIGVTPLGADGAISAGQVIARDTLRADNQTNFGGVSYTWPGLGGGDGQVLSTDEDGVLSWITPAASGWLLTGNAGTTASDFLGTTDDIPLIFKVNALQAGRIGNDLGDTTSSRNVFLGLQAGELNSGVNNVGIGFKSLYILNPDDPDGEGNNTAIGFFSLRDNTSGVNNVAIGSAAGISNTAGSNNVFIGNGAGQGFAADSDGKLYVRNNSEYPHLIIGDFPTDTPGSYGKISINSVLNLIPMASAPSPASAGDMYFDSDNGDLCIYNGTVWHDTAGALCS